MLSYFESFANAGPHGGMLPSYSFRLMSAMLHEDILATMVEYRPLPFLAIGQVLNFVVLENWDSRSILCAGYVFSCVFL